MRAGSLVGGTAPLQHLDVVAPFRQLGRKVPVVVELQGVEMLGKVRRVALAAGQEREKMGAITVGVLFNQISEQVRMTVPLHHETAHRVWTTAVVEKHFRENPPEKPPLDQRNPEILVLTAMTHLLIESTDRLHRTSAAPLTVFASSNASRSHRVSVSTPRFRRQTCGISARTNATFGSLSSAPVETAKKSGVESVVCVEHADVRCGGLCQAEVLGRREASVLRVDDAGSRPVRPRPVCQKLLRDEVGRTIIDDEDLEVLNGLVEDTLNSPLRDTGRGCSRG